VTRESTIRRPRQRIDTRGSTEAVAGRNRWSRGVVVFVVLLLVLHWQQGPGGRAPRRRPPSSAVPQPAGGQAADGTGIRGRGGRAASGAGAGVRGRSSDWGWIASWDRDGRRLSQGHGRRHAVLSARRNRRWGQRGGGRDVDENDMWGPPGPVHSRNLIWRCCWN
jgi:hypothetical protein